MSKHCMEEVTLIFTRLFSPEIGASVRNIWVFTVYLTKVLPVWHLVFLSVLWQKKPDTSSHNLSLFSCWMFFFLFFAETREIISAVSASHVIQQEFSDCLFRLTVDWRGFLSFHHFYILEKELAALWCSLGSSPTTWEFLRDSGFGM